MTNALLFDEDHPLGLCRCPRTVRAALLLPLGRAPMRTPWLATITPLTPSVPSRGSRRSVKRARVQAPVLMISFWWCCSWSIFLIFWQKRGQKTSITSTSTGAISCINWSFWTQAPSAKKFAIVSPLSQHGWGSLFSARTFLPWGSPHCIRNAFLYILVWFLSIDRTADLIPRQWLAKSQGCCCSDTDVEPILCL